MTNYKAYEVATYSEYYPCSWYYIGQLAVSFIAYALTMMYTWRKYGLTLLRSSSVVIWAFFCCYFGKLVGFTTAKLVLGNLPESWPNNERWNLTLVVLYTFDITMFLLFALVFKNMIIMFVVLKASQEKLLSTYLIIQRIWKCFLGFELISVIFI